MIDLPSSTLADEAALAGRDPEAVSIIDLLPAIFDAVPDTSPDEIVKALRWAGEKAMQEAEELRRYDSMRPRVTARCPFPEVEGKRK